MKTENAPEEDTATLCILNKSQGSYIVVYSAAVLRDRQEEKDRLEKKKDAMIGEVIETGVLNEEEVVLHAEMIEKEAVEVIGEEAGAEKVEEADLEAPNAAAPTQDTMIEWAWIREWEHQTLIQTRDIRLTLFQLDSNDNHNNCTTLVTLSCTHWTTPTVQ